MSSYLIQRDGANPLINVPVPWEGKSQYVPHAVRLANGDVWLVVKGDNGRCINGYRSTDGGRSFTREGIVIAPTSGTWDAHVTIDPVVAYDAAADVIHYYYKGNQTHAGYGGWNIGHATAPGSDPLNVTKDPANPILTSASVQSFFGLPEIRDLYFSDVVIDPWNRFVWFGGFYGPHGTPYQIFRCRGTTWNDPTPRGELVSPQAPYDFVQAPCVIRLPGSAQYLMWFTEGYDGTNDDARLLVAATSMDCANWTRVPGVILNRGAPGSWDDRKVFAASFLKGGPKMDTPIDYAGAWRLYYSGGSMADPYRARSGGADVRPVTLVGG